MSYRASSQGIFLKKQFGQHFLRSEAVRQHMVDRVTMDGSSIFEIGCGDGFLTEYFLKFPLARLWVFEIDQDWADALQARLTDKRMVMHHENFLDVDFSTFAPHKPWTLLASLPYNVTFPILHKLQQNRDVIKEGVIIIQEEVAQKIVKQSGRGYGYPSLFFQHYFTWELMDKIPGSAFHPAPKVTSRMLHFAVRTDMPTIPDEENFWKFIRFCFQQPRRTLSNNLATTHYDKSKVSPTMLALRAQQLSMKDLLQLWDAVRL